MTSGMLLPAGTSPSAPIPSVKLPATSVLVIAMGWPETSAVPVIGSQGSQLGPSMMVSSAALGTNTVMLLRGTLPAGSKIVPLTVVRAPPAQWGTVHLPIVHVDCWHCRFWHGPALPPAPLPPEAPPCPEAA